MHTSAQELIGILGKARHSVPRARPGRLRILEDASLWFDIRFIVQGARWNKNLPGVTHFPWQGSTALGTESTCKALRPGSLVGFDQGSITCPVELTITDEQVTRVAGAR